MTLIKCMGCYELRRRELNMSHGVDVVYECPRLPYMTSIGGLLRPASGTKKAAEDCPEDILQHCILCSKPGKSYGRQVVFMCEDHDRAWGKWLEEHPERRAYLSPHGRLKLANWVEVFREFIEGMRPQEKLEKRGITPVPIPDGEEDHA